MSVLRLLPMILLLGSAVAAEPAYPLWDGHESVADYAKRVNLPATKTLDLGNDTKLELVLIPAGRFMMGALPPEAPGETVLTGAFILLFGAAFTVALMLVIIVRAIRKRRRPQFSLSWMLLLTLAVSIALYGGVRWHKMEQVWKDYHAAVVRHSKDYGSEVPAHQVTLTKPFYLGKFEVTQEQYGQVMGSNPSQIPGIHHPVESVNWFMCKSFCANLSSRFSCVVRLMREAEQEFACKAGTTTRYYLGDSDADGRRGCWCEGKSHQEVGLLEPNAFGVYDIMGNIAEWCEDWYGNYQPGPQVDPTGPLTGEMRVMRAGYWCSGISGARSINRGSCPPDHFDFACGFRIVVELPTAVALPDSKP